MRNALFCILTASLFTACGDIRYIGIETRNPSEITYPEHVRKVLITNNAMPQSPDTGCEYILMGKPQLKCEAKADSALLSACHSLGRTLVEADYFDDVLLYDSNLREQSSNLFEDEKLAIEDVQALCKKTDADAVISLDRLLFRTKRDITANPEGYVEGNITIHISGIIRSYLPERNEPAISVVISDSIVLSEWAYTLEQLIAVILPQPEEALRIAAAYIGQKAGTVFAPHWDSENRWFYTSYGSLWKEATAYATSEKWTEAAKRWKYLYDKTSRWQTKAKLASNLALFHELNGEMDKALEMANISHQLFLTNKGETDPTTFFQSQYARTLERRGQDELKLKQQIRK